MSGITAGQIEALAAGFGEGIAEIMKPLEERIRQLEARQTPGTSEGDSATVAALEKRVRDLEARPASLKYCGTFDSRRTYQKDEACTHGGGLWIARRETKAGERPGDDSLAFQLAIKRGADGRDGRDGKDAA